MTWQLMGRAGFSKGEMNTSPVKGKTAWRSIHWPQHSALKFKLMFLGSDGKNGRHNRIEFCGLKSL